MFRRGWGEGWIAVPLVFIAKKKILSDSLSLSFPQTRSAIRRGSLVVDDVGVGVHPCTRGIGRRDSRVLDDCRPAEAVVAALLDRIHHRVFQMGLGSTLEEPILPLGKLALDIEVILALGVFETNATQVSKGPAFSAGASAAPASNNPSLVLRHKMEVVTHPPAHDSADFLAAVDGVGMSSAFIRLLVSATTKRRVLRRGLFVEYEVLSRSGMKADIAFEKTSVPHTLAIAFEPNLAILAAGEGRRSTACSTEACHQTASI